METFVVVEYADDRTLLEAILPAGIHPCITVKSTGRGSQALAAAGTLLLTRAVPVVLLLNANTSDAAQIEERQRILHSIMVGYLPEPNLPFEILLAVPELEVILVHDRTVAERLVGRVITDVEWKLAQKAPKEFLSPDLDKTRFNLDDLLAKLTPDDMEHIRQHPLMLRLVNFLRQAVPTTE